MVLKMITTQKIVIMMTLMISMNKMYSQTKTLLDLTHIRISKIISLEHLGITGLKNMQPIEPLINL
jgi:hypothetical protein